MGKHEEVEGFNYLISKLPKGIHDVFINSYSNFENETNSDKIEDLIARWIDNLQGDHFALTFGNNLPEYSSVIEKIIKQRSILRSYRLINHLKQHQLIEAAEEVDLVTKTHIGLIKQAGITINLAEFEF